MASDGDARAKLYAEIDPPRPAASACAKTISLALNVPLLAAIFALPFLEDALRASAPAWGYAATKFAGLPQLYGLVVVGCVLLPNLVKIWIGFGVTGKGRKKYGYKNPVHYASVDIHVEDVLRGGAVLSGGDVTVARKKLDDTVRYSCHQRADGNTTEWFPTFLTLALVGGVVYPASAAFWGVVWSISRVVWAAGYHTGNPIDRYGNPLGGMHWLATLGCIALSIGAASNMLKSA